MSRNCCVHGFKSNYDSIESAIVGFRFFVMKHCDRNGQEKFQMHIYLQLNTLV